MQDGYGLICGLSSGLHVSTDICFLFLSEKEVNELITELLRDVSNSHTTGSFLDDQETQFLSQV